MAHRMFENFLDSAEAYEVCEQYWERLVRELEESLNQTNEWKRWLLRHYPDGTPVEMDGNPIYDARSRKINRAFRVLQHRPVSENLEIVAWLKTYDDESPEFPSAEMVINLSLSEESEHMARELLPKITTTSSANKDCSFIMLPASSLPQAELSFPFRLVQRDPRQ